ncbi:MAG: SoxR reducing system RseC family protein [Gammaproteobacteria bacterium]|nr:SoxR reducing system RseC family protein [Gammaproteobacteria bacterium]
MIEQQAKVIAQDDKTVWLQAERQSTCSKCQVRQGCGTAMLANHVGKRFSRIAVPKTHDVVIGQDVQLAIPEEALLHGTFMMYIVPLLAMFASAAIAHSLNLNELVEIIFGFAGLFAGFYWVKSRLNTRTDRFQARISEENK